MVSLSLSLSLSLTQEAGLANVLDLGAGLADFCLLVPHSGSRTPPEDGEWPSTHLHGEKRGGERKKEEREGGV